jgi:outer membrane protein OmpA-like peptidoglycan-associated protein
MKHTIILLLALCVAWGLQMPTQAQSKQVDAFGFALEVPAHWEVDPDVKANRLYLTDPTKSLSETPMLTVDAYDQAALADQTAIQKEVIKQIRETYGNSYQYSIAKIKERAAQSSLHQHGQDFEVWEFVSEMEADGQSFTWVEVWYTFHELHQEHLFFTASADLVAGNAESQQKVATLMQMLSSTRRLDKTIAYQQQTLKPGDALGQALSFVADKTTLESQAQKELKALIKFLKDYPQVEVRIVGYSQKNDEANRASLAMQRAEAIRSELKNAKIDENRLKVGAQQATREGMMVQLFVHRIR